MLSQILQPIAPLAHADLQQRLQDLLDHKTKPLGALGQLEALALRLGMILQSETPELEQPQIMVYAADHGLAAHGISAYPSDVTWQMVNNFLAGGAAINVLARQHDLALQVVDCGVRHDFEQHLGLIDKKVAYGSADSLSQAAMSAAQCEQALHNGAQLLEDLPGNALILGEMGIGNTSAASLLMARLCDLPIGDCTGAGTGLNPSAISRKTQILAQVLENTPTRKRLWMPWLPSVDWKSPPWWAASCRPRAKTA